MKRNQEWELHEYLATLIRATRESWLFLAQGLFFQSKHLPLIRLDILSISTNFDERKMHRKRNTRCKINRKACQSCSDEKRLILSTFKNQFLFSFQKVTTRIERMQLFNRGGTRSLVSLIDSNSKILWPTTVFMDKVFY